MRAYASNDELSDDGLAVLAARVPAAAVLDALATPPPPPDPAGEVTPLEALWTEHAQTIEDLLAAALAGPPAERRAALAALDGRPEGLGLGALLPVSAALSPQGKRVLERLWTRLEAAVAARLDDPDRATRLHALGIASKLRDPRVSLRHVLGALAAAYDPGVQTARPDAVGAARLAAEMLVGTGRLDGASLARALAPQLAEPDWNRRLAAVSVARAGSAAAAALFETALADPNPFVRAEAAAALGDGPTGGPALVRAAADARAAVRAAAVPGLGRRGDQAAREALARLAADDAVVVRTAAQAALAAAREASPAARETSPAAGETSPAAGGPAR